MISQHPPAQPQSPSPKEKDTEKAPESSNGDALALRGGKPRPPPPAEVPSELLATPAELAKRRVDRLAQDKLDARKPGAPHNPSFQGARQQHAAMLHDHEVATGKATAKAAADKAAAEKAEKAEPEPEKEPPKGDKAGKP
jgi:hypothetical protein